MSTCALCGQRDYEVEVRLVLYTNGRYDSIARCRNVVACERRVIAAGRKWTVT